MSTSERQLKMHPKLLMDVIKRQAGTLDKAILEGVMNAEEAGASRIDVQLDKDFLSITDDGKGIVDLKEVEEYFETFGTPHEAAERKKFAQFRMGRGQLFSFGVNKWRTSTFQMTVDIANKGLDWELQENLPHKDGCSIEVSLYDDRNPMKLYSENIKSIIEDIRRQIEYMDTPIYVNGEKINHNPNKLKWDYEDENAYYMFNAGTHLRYYNLGAFVKEEAAAKAGVTGVIVSKKQLKVNFARNDVQNDCEVYHAIQQVVLKNRKKRRRSRRRSLTKAERISTLRDIRDGVQDWQEIKNLGIIENSSGNRLSLDAIRKTVGFWSFAPEGDRLADKMTQAGNTLCLNEDILNELDYYGEPKFFFEWLFEDSMDLNLFTELAQSYSSFEEVREAYSESYEILGDKQLTNKEKAILRTIRYASDWGGRQIFIGVSTTAAAWTDGDKYIAIDKDFLNDLRLPSSEGTAHLVNVMVHELAHDEKTMGTHTHGEEFYRRFHDLSMKRGYNSYHTLIATIDNKLKRSKRLMKLEREEAKAAKAEAKVQDKLGIAAKSK